MEGKDNWTNLFVWLKKELKKTMEEKKLVQKYVDRIHALENNPEELPDAGSKGHILLKEKVVKPDSEILDFLRKMEMMPQAHLRGKGSHGVHREFIVGPLEINLRFIEHR